MSERPNKGVMRWVACRVSPEQAIATVKRVKHGKTGTSASIAFWRERMANAARGAAECSEAAQQHGSGAVRSWAQR